MMIAALEWDFNNIALSLSFLSCIVVEVTLNRTEYGSQRLDQPENVNFEPIIRGLKSDIF